MYALAAEVRLLCKNRPGHLSDEDIAAAAAIVDAEIDGEIAQVYYWPTSPEGISLNGGDETYKLPVLIRAAADLLTAGLLEQQSHAQMAAVLGEGGTEGATVQDSLLQRRGRRIIKTIVSGAAYIPGLERYTQTQSTAMPVLHSPVRGFRGGRG